MLVVYNTHWKWLVVFFLFKQMHIGIRKTQEETLVCVFVLFFFNAQCITQVESLCSAFVAITATASKISSLPDLIDFKVFGKTVCLASLDFKLPGKQQAASSKFGLFLANPLVRRVRHRDGQLPRDCHSEFFGFEVPASRFAGALAHGSLCVLVPWLLLAIQTEMERRGEKRWFFFSEKKKKKTIEPQKVSDNCFIGVV